MDLPLAKSEPISNAGGVSVTAYLRNTAAVREGSKRNVRITTLQTPRSVRKESEKLLHMQSRAAFGEDHGNTGWTPCSPWRTTLEQTNSHCSLWKTPCQGRRRCSGGSCNPWRAYTGQDLWLTETAHAGADFLVGIAVCGRPMQEESVPEGLYPTGRTHARAVLEGLQPIGRAHFGEDWEERHPVRMPTCWNGGKCRKKGIAKRNCYHLISTPIPHSPYTAGTGDRRSRGVRN